MVVLFTWEWTRHLNLVELLTRARNRLLVVTARFHHYMPGRYDDLVMVLEAAHDHGAGRSCYECPTLGEGCRFAGVQLLQRVMLGDEVRARRDSDSSTPRLKLKHPDRIFFFFLCKNHTKPTISLANPQREICDSRSFVACLEF